MNDQLQILHGIVSSLKVLAVLPLLQAFVDGTDGVGFVRQVTSGPFESDHGDYEIGDDVYSASDAVEDRNRRMPT